jgi:simple sugar transport system substrate-binding protein
MLNRARLAVSLCIVSVVACTCTACGGGSKTDSTSTAATKGGSAGSSIEIAYVCAQPNASAFFGPIQKGALDAGAAMGVHVTYTGVGPNNSTPAGLVSLIQAAVNQKPDELVYCNAFPPAQDAVIKQAVEAGIGVFEAINTPPKTFDGPYGRGPIAWSNGSNYNGGVQAGNEMATAGIKHPVCVNHTPKNQSVAERCMAFVKALAAKGVKAETLNLPLSAETNITAYVNDVKGYLQAHPNVDGLFAQGNTQGTAAVRAVQQVGRSGAVKVGGFDMSPEVFADVRNGKMLFALWQQPYLLGYLPVVEAALHAKYGMAPDGQLNLGPLLVTKANASKLAKAASAGLL